MKSSSKDLDRAYDQAIDYLSGIKERDIPRYLLVCNFQRFHMHDLTTQSVTEFKLKDLYQNVKSFGFMTGYKTQIIKVEDQINIKAAHRTSEDDILKLIKSLFLDVLWAEFEKIKGNKTACSIFTKICAA